MGDDALREVGEAFAGAHFEEVGLGNAGMRRHAEYTGRPGLKATLPEAHVQVNGAIYHYVYTNKQALVLSTSGTSSIPEYQVSTSDQKANGVDLELRWQPVSALAVGLTAAYIDSTYSKYESAALLQYWQG